MEEKALQLNSQSQDDHMYACRIAVVTNILVNSGATIGSPVT